MRATLARGRLQLLETLAQLLCDWFQAGRGLRNCLEVAIDLVRFLHRLAADCQPRIVWLRSERRGQRAEFRQSYEEVNVFFEVLLAMLCQRALLLVSHLPILMRSRSGERLYDQISDR